jgi:hypothetical protein
MVLGLKISYLLNVKGNVKRMADQTKNIFLDKFFGVDFEFLPI